MDKIVRDVFVCKRTVPRPIDYPQGTNAIPLWFYMKDYTIPEGAAAKLYMETPGGDTIYLEGEISDDLVVFEVPTAMSEKEGRAKITVRIMNGEEILNTFNFPFYIAHTSYSDTAEEGGNSLSGLDAQIKEAVEKYLTEHPATDTPIDDTLTKEGQAADAKAVGDALDALRELIEKIGDIEWYEGETTVTPMVAIEQVLETAYKRMGEDVTVTKIPCSDVSNDAGGKTVTIG